MIAVDAMGGDYAPKALVQGSFAAAVRGIPILLFGDLSIIEPMLAQLCVEAKISLTSLPIKLVDCSQVINMEDEPSRAVLQKKDSSLVRAMQAVANGQAQVVVSAGNSGACLVAGTLLLERVPGILRPAIGGFLPTRNGSIFCLDMGANTDCKPEYLEQFALMGEVFVKMKNKIENPRIALVSNGHEPYKGNLLTKQAYARLKDLPLNFIGNLESRDIFDDKADVLVCDGFVGNVLLKAVQGTAKAMVTWIDIERKKSWWHTLGLLISKKLFKNLKQKIDYSHKSGALLLGLNYPLIIAHGCSNAVAIENTLIFAESIIKENVIKNFNHLLTLKLQNVGTFKARQQSAIL